MPRFGQEAVSPCKDWRLRYKARALPPTLTLRISLWRHQHQTGNFAKGFNLRQCRKLVRAREILKQIAPHLTKTNTTPLQPASSLSFLVHGFANQFPLRLPSQKSDERTAHSPSTRIVIEGKRPNAAFICAEQAERKTPRPRN